MPREQAVRIYARSDASEPFTQWLRGLRDGRTRNRIRQRIARVRLGNFGDTRFVGEGVHELRIPFGPGFRVYFGRDGDGVVILLCGGDKSTQVRDIERAQDYWRDYRSRAHG
jgi:putative addiction module killer protein